MNNYEYFLQQAGIASTRIPSLYEAMNDLHKAVSYMDKGNRERLEIAAPWVMEAVNHYASTDPILTSFHLKLQRWGDTDVEPFAE